MESKTRFVVSGRLSKDDPFLELEVRSKFWTLSEAQTRGKEWLETVSDLLKAKPEVSIESEELPHLASCFKCSNPLFKDDLVFNTRQGKCCPDCVADIPLIDGYYCLLEEDENNSNISLDKDFVI